MSKVELQVIDSLNSGSGLTKINENFQEIQEAFDNTLSRDGASPNTILANVDANGKRIFNLPTPGSNNDAARLQDIIDTVLSEEMIELLAPLIAARITYPMGLYDNDGSQFVTNLNEFNTRVVATIGSGQSLSGSIDLGKKKVVGIEFPSSWTTASITFQTSSDGSTWRDLYDGEFERTINSAGVVPGRTTTLSLADWLLVRYLKVRSGTSASPVNQGADRDVILITG